MHELVRQGFDMRLVKYNLFSSSPVH